MVFLDKSFPFVHVTEIVLSGIWNVKVVKKKKNSDAFMFMFTLPTYSLIKHATHDYY